AGLAPQNPVSSQVYDLYYWNYDSARIAKLEGFLKQILAKNSLPGQKTALSSDENQAIANLLQSVQSAAAAAAPKAGSASAAGSSTVHAFAALALVPMMAHAALWTVPVLAAGAAAYYGLKRFSRASRSQVQEPVHAQSKTFSELEKAAERIELTAKSLSLSAGFGTFLSSFKGTDGTEFAEIGLYQPGTDLKRVNWSATARSQDQIFVNRYHAEREMPFLILADLSRSGGVDARGLGKAEAIRASAAALALAASRLGLSVGAVLFTDRVEAYVPPARGAEHARQIARQIQTLAPVGAATDLNPALKRTLAAAGNKAIVAIVSDFLAPNFSSALGALAAKAEVSIVRVADPAELEPMPAVGVVDVADPETGESRTVDTSSRAFQRGQAAAIAERESTLAKSFSKARKVVTLTTDGDALSELVSHFGRGRAPRAGQGEK
ncbi:MAG: DUF58 domain-containing protein, partial [Elusimicrobia bacterium]|nr:DUF58 domain-containing protein [Elusimicrobiota bacterium]